tara:strand:- start:111 stop:299 length:189 start_codon:yes stop_codon:yes gene_type:complete
MGIAKAKHAVSTPAANSHGAHMSGTTNAKVNIGKDARKIMDVTTTMKMFMVCPVFHSSKATP